MVIGYKIVGGGMIMFNDDKTTMLPFTTIKLTTIK